MTAQSAAGALWRGVKFAFEAIYNMMIGVVIGAVFLIVMALLIMPLGHMVFDYWTAKIQAVQQAPPPATLKGKKP